MDIETKIELGFLFTFVAGMLIGWYITWEKYHQEEEKRKAIKGYLDHEKIKAPPKTEWEEFIDIIAKLNNTDVDEYRIVYGDDVFVMTSKMEPKKEEEKA